MRAFVAQVGALDRAWLREIAEWKAPRWLDRVIRTVTHLGGATATVAIGALLVVPAATRTLGLAALVANALSHGLVQLLKRSVLRERPGLADDGPVPLARIPDAYSFPSGHSAAALAVALPAALSGHPLGIPAVGLALLVGASRVYLRVHYVTDVLMGQILGALGAIAAVHLLI